MLLATALALLGYRMCSIHVYCSNKPAAVAPKETITHHFSFLELGKEENCRCSQNLWRRKEETERKTSQWIARFYYFRHLYQLMRHVYCLHTRRVAHRYGQLYLHCSLIYFGFFQLFLHSDQPLWGWNNPVQRCLPVGGRLHYPRRRRWCGQCTDWQTALMCNRRRPAATSSRRASFSALASANSSCILHRAQQHHADASACQ